MKLLQEKITKPQYKAMQHVQDMSKGWPVGIPINERMANTLVDKYLAEWAQPFWRYPKPVHAVRLTVKGQVALKLSKK